MTNTDNYVYEYATLGCIIKENHLIEDPNHKEELFTGQRRVLYRAMKELNAEKKPIDMVTLLTKQMQCDFGGVATITECQNRSYVKKYESYLKIAREEYTKREKVGILNNSLQDGWELERITEELNRLVSHDVNDRKEITDILKDMVEEPWVERQESEQTFKTGITSIDLMTGGLKNKTATVVAARPSQGKTDFCNTLAIQAGKQGYKPIFFSLEMDAQSITRRLVGTVGNINRMKLKDTNKYLSEEQKNKWMTILGEVSKIGMVIYDKSAQELNEIKAKVRKERLLNPNGKLLVMIDYLTLVEYSESKYFNEVQKIGKIAEGLKAIAKEFNCVMIILSQLSRKCEERENKRPISSDIRESGAVEQMADLIICLYREDYYKPMEDPRDANSMELIVTKNREGATGTVYISYNKMTGVMKDYPDDKPPYAKKNNRN